MTATPAGAGSPAFFMIHMTEIDQLFRADREFRKKCAREAIRTGDWHKAFGRVSSQERPPLLKQLWSHLPAADKAEAMAAAISDGDAPSQVLSFLVEALRELRIAGTLAFDDLAARDAFAQLPDQFRIYRGTVQKEFDTGLFGVCWTLKRDRAVWFATGHGRFRNTRSSPILLCTSVARADVSGFIVERQEDEVLVAIDMLPLRSISVESLSSSGGARDER